MWQIRGYVKGICLAIKVGSMTLFAHMPLYRETYSSISTRVTYM